MTKLRVPRGARVLRAGPSEAQHFTMYEGNHVVLMAEYSRFMNEKLYGVVSTLGDDERREGRGAFFGSIHATLEHLLWADRIWMTRFDGTPRATSKLREPIFASFDAMHEERLRFDLEILEYATGLSQDALNAPLEWRSAPSRAGEAHPRWVYMTHMFNHGTHHRGQITTLLSQRGIDVGATDLHVMPLLLDSPD